jgi:hypothetical protein
MRVFIDSPCPEPRSLARFEAGWDLGAEHLDTLLESKRKRCKLATGKSPEAKQNEQQMQEYRMMQSNYLAQPH